jgi:TetR/AcrR family transcriptional regulator, transcriptional repressor for nem operon
MDTKSNRTKSERTRQQIIEVAAAVFNRKGYAGTSISDITDATGLTKGSIYGNFKDKDDLALCVFNFNAKRVTEAFSAGLSKAKNSIELLMVFPDTFRSIFDDVIKGGGCPILNTLMDAVDTHSVLYKEAQKIIQKVKKSIMQAVESGKKRHEIIQEVNAEVIANTLISLIEGAAAMARTMEDKNYFYHTIKYAEQFIESLKDKGCPEY